MTRDTTQIPLFPRVDIGIYHDQENDRSGLIVRFETGIYMPASATPAETNGLNYNISTSLQKSTTNLELLDSLINSLQEIRAVAARHANNGTPAAVDALNRPIHRRP